MHLDMQLAIDAYMEASQEALQHHATALEEEVSIQTSALQERARQLEALYLISATASRELDPGEGPGINPAAHRRYQSAPPVLRCISWTTRDA